MTPTPPPGDPRLDRLFVRYWDNTITADEAIELNARLVSDPVAREWFRWFCTQAVFAAEWVAVHRNADRPTTARRPSRLPDRRRMLVGLGAGLAASAAGVLIVRQTFGVTKATPVTVTALQGQITTRLRPDEELKVGAIVPIGDTVAALGATSSVVLSRPDGSSVTLSSGAAVTVADHGDRLIVAQGGVTAELRTSAPGVPPMTLCTGLAEITSADGAVVGVHTDTTLTEVQVQHGAARVADRDGDRLGDLHGGERITMWASGGHRQEPIPEMPERFALDLKPGSPVLWSVGGIGGQDGGPALVPHLWYDPYHSAELYQARSNNYFTRGLVRLWPDSRVMVRYRAERSGRGQACLVVRQMRGERPGRPKTGVLEWNGEYQACRPGEWRTVSVRAADMLDCKEAPTFGEPWVAFLVIFNTYDADLGLRVADLRVSRPGDPADG